jgi:hypothetical protein
MKSFTFAALLLGALSLSSFTVISIEDKPSKSEGTNVVQFRIELCTFRNTVPVKTAEQLRNIGGVMPVKDQGKSVYYTAPYGSETEANNDLAKFQQMGFEDAKQVVRYNGKFISLKEYHEINKSASDIRIWK